MTNERIKGLGKDRASSFPIIAIMTCLFLFAGLIFVYVVDEAVIAHSKEICDAVLVEANMSALVLDKDTTLPSGENTINIIYRNTAEDDIKNSYDKYLKILKTNTGAYKQGYISNLKVKRYVVYYVTYDHNKLYTAPYELNVGWIKQTKNESTGMYELSCIHTNEPDLKEASLVITPDGGKVTGATIYSKIAVDLKLPLLEGTRTFTRENTSGLSPSD